jgi:hypothetical protein
VSPRRRGSLNRRLGEPQSRSGCCTMQKISFPFQGSSNGGCVNGGKVKWPGHETVHSPPSSVEVKIGGGILHSPIRLHSFLLN